MEIHSTEKQIGRFTKDEISDLRFLLDSASSDDARPIITGVHAEKEHLITANGFQLSIIKNIMDLPVGTWAFPRKLERLMELTPIEGSYPDWRSIIKDVRDIKPKGRKIASKVFASFSPKLFTSISKHAENSLRVIVVDRKIDTRDPLEIQGTLKSGTRFYSLLMPMHDEVKAQNHYDVYDPLSHGSKE